ncbi:uncharacterized protein LOC123550671 [Mercenaria mercenaria]|uniref:uncharacterized protein LOC123550671 n=1 Tax=Mercenaria mercenaria TaxID=6596 RepID=UPI00234EA67A|nr:uncharacterized protein LOC123550671 [Mercenaria mercenaria]
MDRPKSRPDTLQFTESETELLGADLDMPLPKDFGRLFPGTVVFHHTKVKFVPVLAQRSSGDTRDQGSQADTETRIHVSTNTQTECEVGNTSNEDNVTEEEWHVDEDSREEIIRTNLEQHLIYISHCIKPDDLILHLHCFSEEQKSDILSEKNLIKASRKALEMLLHDVEEPGRFVELRDALCENDGNPKVVSILDGKYSPDDQNYVKVVELFTPEIIVRLEPSVLLPHLVQKDVFKQMDVEEITAEEKNHGKMRAACVLLMYLPRRTVDWFKCFLQVLVKCNLEDIAEMLDPDMFKDINENDETKISEKLDDDSMKAGKDEVIYSRNNKTKSPVVDEAFENSDDAVIFSEYSYEQLDYLRGNVAERKKIDKTMADYDAEIVWPDKKRGKNQILLRSISKEKTDATTWSRKKKVWKQNVIVTLKKLFAKVDVPENRSSLSKIMCGTNTPCKGLYGKRQTTTETHESSGTTKSDSCFSYANVGTASETELRCMSRNDKTASSEEPNAPVLESNSANRNDETLSNVLIHESEPEVYNSKEMQKYAVCEMTCGRRISVMKGSLVDLRVDVMVNTTNKALSLTTGLAETISEKGGEKIRTACKKYFQTHGSIDEGEAFVSEAGSLPAKHVVHVNSPVWREGTEDEHRLLRQTVMKALKQASDKKAETIALPAISCGISGFTSKTATALIVRAVRNFFREDQSSSLKHVYLVDITRQTAKRFQEALCREFKDDTKCVVEVVKESL